MATIKDVAKKAGVSVATVSRVLNTPDAVRERTREQVLSAIDELQYSPNFLGRNLRMMETKRILVVLNTISNQFFSRVVRGIEERAQEEKYAVMICTTRGNQESMESYVHMLQTRAVDGMILTTHELRDEAIVTLSKRFPVICACEPVQDPRLTCVSIDDEKAGEDAVRFLLDRGKRRIALFGGGTYTYSSVLRERGYRKALQEAGMPVDETLIYSEGLTFKAGVRAASRLLREQPELPDAIFAFSDSTAIGAMKELNNHGVQVPRDISVIGFDNTAVSEMYIPSITTVAQPKYTMGFTAMDLLIQKINGTTDVSNQILSHEIIIRDSVN